MAEPTMAQVTAAMRAMIDKAMETPNEPVAMAIVDSAGNLLAYLTMDNLRIFSRRHALRKAHTSALMGLDSGENAQRLHSQGRNIADQGDPMMTYGHGRGRDHEGRRHPRRHWRRRLPQRPVRRGPVPRRPGGHESLGPWATLTKAGNKVFESLPFIGRDGVPWVEFAHSQPLGWPEGEQFGRGWYVIGQRTVSRQIAPRSSHLPRQQELLEPHG